MFIVHESNFVGLKPQRGGVARSSTDHAAPTELRPRAGGAVTINMSLLWSWPWVAARQNRTKAGPTSQWARG